MNREFSILKILRHRLGTDGHGVTTLVGLGGCPLNCEYCINKKALESNKFKSITPEQLLQEVIQDYCYFVGTGGGITFGGGEPLLQAYQIKEFVKIIPNGISINIETSLNVSQDLLELVVQDVKWFLIDIKDIDSEIYEKYTKGNNLLVLKNLQYLASKNYQDKCKIRIPLIPNYNSEDNRLKSIEYLKSLGFNNFEKFNYIIRKN